MIRGFGPISIESAQPDGVTIGLVWTLTIPTEFQVVVGRRVQLMFVLGSCDFALLRLLLRSFPRAHCFEQNCSVEHGRPDFRIYWLYDGFWPIRR